MVSDDTNEDEVRITTFVKPQGEEISPKSKLAQFRQLYKVWHKGRHEGRRRGPRFWHQIYPREVERNVIVRLASSPTVRNAANQCRLRKKSSDGIASGITWHSLPMSKPVGLHRSLNENGVAYWSPRYLAQSRFRIRCSSFSPTTNYD